MNNQQEELEQFLNQTDFEAAEEAAIETVVNQTTLSESEDDCEGCKI